MSVASELYNRHSWSVGLFSVVLGFFQAVLGWVFVKFLVLLVKGFFCVCVFVLFTNTKLK